MTAADGSLLRMGGAVVLLGLTRVLGTSFWQTVVWCVLATAVLALAFLSGVYALVGLRERGKIDLSWKDDRREG